MKSLSKREQVFVGIFIVALVWGIWNYRDMIMGRTGGANPPRPAAALMNSPTGHASSAYALADSSAAVRAGDAIKLTRSVKLTWGGDPFHRSWRNSLGETARQTSRR